jgi:hypothetical protein
MALLGAAAVGQQPERANELTLAGLRPGRDTMDAALKKYEAKYSVQTEDSAREWRDSCTGRTLAIDADAQAVIQGITVSAFGQRDGKCERRTFDQLNMQGWVTGHGIRLGDPQHKVIEVYGEPNSTGPSVKGEQELEFLHYAFDWAGSDLPQVLQIYCARDSGRVVEITLAYPSL